MLSWTQLAAGFLRCRHGGLKPASVTATVTATASVFARASRWPVQSLRSCSTSCLSPPPPLSPLSPLSPPPLSPLPPKDGEPQTLSQSRPQSRSRSHSRPWTKAQPQSPPQPKPKRQSWHKSDRTSESKQQQPAIHSPKCINKGNQTFITLSEGDKPIKRKYVLICSYLGTNYYGVQKIDNEAMPTIELHLERALHKIGLIADSNFGDLSRCDWSRSSRTDKGVHAGRIVISAKLLVPDKWLENDLVRTNQVCDALNELLPSDIRVWSCVRMARNFQARGDVTWRHYEYILPTSNLKGYENMTDQQMCDKLNSSLHKFVGMHTFQNFHRVANRKLSGFTNHSIESASSSNNSGSCNNNDMEGNEDGYEGEEDDDFARNDQEYAQEGKADSTSQNAVKPKTPRRSPSPSYSGFSSSVLTSVEEFEHIRSIFFKHINDSEARQNQYFGEFIERRITSETNIPIYKSEVSEILNINDEKFFKITIIGKNFMLNQIRLMIGAAIFDASGIFPSNSIELGFLAPFMIRFPMAPAEGLVLVGNGFSDSTQVADLPVTLCDTYSKRNPLKYYSLMNQTEYQSSQDFLQRQIYQAIARDWTTKMGAYTFLPGDKVLSDWVDVSFSPHPNVVNAWNEIYAYLKQKEEERTVRRFERFKQAVEETIAELKTNPKLIIPRGSVLPNGLYTAIACKFNVLPTPLIDDAAMGLATRVLQGQIPANKITNEHLVDYIAKNGGLVTIAKIPKHRQLV